MIKEKYFSHKTIDTKALELLNNTKIIVGRTKIQEFIPKKSALIVIDMQKYFCDEFSNAFIPSSVAIIPKIKILAEAYVDKNLPVIFTKHINTCENAALMGKWWGKVLSVDSHISEIISELNIKNAKVIEKTQYDSFYNTDLEDFLRNNNISQLVITGVMTHLCCETTARAAFVRGFETLLCIDSTATYNENFHAAAMLNLAHGFSDLTLADEIYGKLKNEAR